MSDLRVEHKGTGEGNTLRLAAADGARKALGEMGDVKELEHRVHAPRAFPFGDSLPCKPIRDVVEDAQMLEQRMILIEDAQTTLLQRQGGNRAAVLFDLT